MKLKVTEGSIVLDDKDSSGTPKEYKAGDTFERRKDETVDAWLETGAVVEDTDGE